MMWRILLMTAIIKVENFPLTKKKAKWAINRSNHLVGNKLAHNASIEEKYHYQIRILVSFMTNETKKEIQKLSRIKYTKDGKLRRSKVAMDTNLGSQARITLNQLTKKFNDLFASKAKRLENLMFGKIDKTSKASL